MRLAAALMLLLSLGVRHAAFGISITGADWVVHLNLPDQLTTLGSATAEEFAIRDAFVARLNALQPGQTATLATYTFSGSNTTVGAAGPILNAMEAALNRSVAIRFIADHDIVLTNMNGGTNSLASLAARPTNPLVVAQAASAAGIMHHKLGLFDQGPSNRWVMAGSWNFTAAACSQQWNVMLEARNEALFAAYASECAELLAGRFHDSTNKAHAHDRSAFRLADSWTNDFVRYAPYPDGTPGGSNALTEVTNAIRQAEGQIVFALNQITRLQVATALVAACNRGVEVLGVIALSDATNQPNDYPVYAMLTNPASYATTNRVRVLLAYDSADGAALDNGRPDLVHAKWMALDPFGPRPRAILGSANWTDAALASESSNDENLLFLHHGGIARALYAHFKRMTRMLNDRSDFTFTQIAPGQVDLRPTDTNLYLLEQATSPGVDWTNVGVAVTGQLSGLAWPVDTSATTRWFRARRAP